MIATAKQFLVSASRLSDGAVLYLAEDRRWVERFDQAARHVEPARRDEELAVEVGVSADGALLLSARERLRRDGAAQVMERLGHTRPTR
jgi:hypothetical protein